MADCVFCRIIAGDIPAARVYEDDKRVAFKDLEPQAPVHLLVIPKLHIHNLDAVEEATAPIIGHIFGKIPGIMAAQGITEGYRVVNNCGQDGGQTVEHLHFHCLGGRDLGWPPG